MRPDTLAYCPAGPVVRVERLPVGVNFSIAGETYRVADTLGGGVWRRASRRSRWWEACGIEESNAVRREFSSLLTQRRSA